MKHPHSPTKLDRRHFFKAGLLGSTAMAVTGASHNLFAAVTKPQRPLYDGLKLGMASYTFRKFSLDQAIAMSKEAGAVSISLKDFHLPYKSSPAERQEARRKVESGGLVLASGGVIYMKNNEEEIRRFFEYAKDAGMPTIVCSPDTDALDTVEKMVKEYNIRIAIHNHGPGDKKYPSPLDVLRLVKDRDERMGICIDVGHTVRIGEDPVEAIHQCAKRLYDFHIKDETEATAKGKPIPVGQGVIDIVGVLKALLEIQYAFNIGLEYEDKENDPMPGVIESFGYMRGVLAAI
ncbi:MAG TPA: sugar phosphate isomerase/epimerase [Verrucomicrobiae bacterium]|nr:sugar phosphate isomerase/epimerase [Verrucomicrobiae bacterium]